MAIPLTESLRYEKALMETFPHIKCCDLDSHGFNVVDVTGERIQVEYWLVDTVLKRTPNVAQSAIWEVKHGEPNLKRVR